MMQPDEPSLVGFVKARLAEDEHDGRRLASVRGGVPVFIEGDGEPVVIAGDRLLAEVEADRLLIAKYESAKQAEMDHETKKPIDGNDRIALNAEGWRLRGWASALEYALKARATVWSGHEGYDPSWRPDAA